MLGLYKRVCRKYLNIYPGCIRDYIEAYREMWEDEDSYSADFSQREKETVFQGIIVCLWEVQWGR